MAALAACGPERLRYGSARDLVLGLRFVSGRGRLVSTGGRVVKNVAGYDLGRLLVGSAGTLGLLTELTLRVSSIPEACRAVCGRGPLDSVARVAADLVRSNLDPTLIVATPLNGSSPGGPTEQAADLWTITVGVEGFGETVDAQAGRCKDLFLRNGLSDEAPVEYAVHDGPFRNDEETLHRSSCLLRADLPLDMVAAFVRETSRSMAVDHLFVDFGCGRVRAGLSDLSYEAWERLCRQTRKMGGTLLLEHGPDAFKEHQDVFGLPQPAWAVMHRIKDALDPHNVFAPGRMPGRK
jgi:FAD/FMN-containing dehydrogenase